MHMAIKSYLITTKFSHQYFLLFGADNKPLNLAVYVCSCSMVTRVFSVILCGEWPLQLSY